MGEGEHKFSKEANGSTHNDKQSLDSIGEIATDDEKREAESLDVAPQGHESGDVPGADDKTALNNTSLYKETKILRDTLDLLWNQTLEQRNMCEQLEHENAYLEDYISNLMTSSNVLDK